MRNFSGYPVVRTLCPHCRGMGSSPAWKTKVPLAAWPKKTKIKIHVWINNIS